MAILALTPPPPPATFVASLAPGGRISVIIGPQDLIWNKKKTQINSGGKGCYYMGSTRHAIKQPQVISRLEMSQ